MQLMRRVIDRVPAADDADHVPMLVDQNTQVPSRIAWLIDGAGADPAPVLVAMAMRLEAAGASALAMPCNTAHHYAADIAAAVRIPFLDMVALSARAAAEVAGDTGKVGILCSPATRKVRLFDDALTACGLEAVYPSDQAALLAAIRQIKAEGPVALARSTLAAASSELLAQGAEAQVIACTEFSLISASLPTGVAAIDTLDRLASEIISFSIGPASPQTKVDAQLSRASTQSYQTV